MFIKCQILNISTGRIYEIKKEAIKSNPLSIEYIDYVEEDLQVLAVKILWNSLRLIKNPSDRVKEEAVKSKGWAIQYIQSPSEKLCLIAVKND